MAHGDTSQFTGVLSAVDGKPFGDKTLWVFKDGNGEKIGQTWDAGLKEIAHAHVGSRVVIELKEHHREKDGRTFINQMVQAVRYAPEEKPPESGPPSQEVWDAKELRGHRRAAMAQAISLMGVFPAEFKTPTEAFHSAAAFADKIVEHVYKESKRDDFTNPDDPDDIPF